MDEAPVREPAVRGVRAPGGTLPDAAGAERSRTARNLRRAGLGLLLVVVLLGASGLLGVRVTSASADQDGWSLQVEAPSIARAALDAPVRIVVERDGGFDRPVEIAIDQALLRHLDVNLVAPAPSAEVSEGDRLRWTFDPPVGERLVVMLDARISPSLMPGRETFRFAVVDEDETVVALERHLLVLP